MATVVKVTPNVRREARTKYSSHTGDIYVMILESQDGQLSVEHIYAASPTASNFNDAPTGSILYDTAGVIVAKIKTGATTWANLHA